MKPLTQKKLLAGDLLIALFAALLPGIRGYTNWQPYEYGALIFLSGFAIFLRHKMKKI